MVVLLVCTAECPLSSGITKPLYIPNCFHSNVNKVNSTYIQIQNYCMQSHNHTYADYISKPHCSAFVRRCPESKP